MDQSEEKAKKPFEAALSEKAIARFNKIATDFNVDTFDLVCWYYHNHRLIDRLEILLKAFLLDPLLIEKGLPSQVNYQVGDKQLSKLATAFKSLVAILNKEAENE